MMLLLLFPAILLARAQQSSFPIETDDRQPRQVYDVLVLGAGLTGLSFARKIRQLRPNATVVLLEARGQVGGRVRARSMAKATGDDWVDLGSQFISRDHHALQRVAGELDLKLVPQSTCGDRSLLLEGSRRRKREVSWSPELSVRPSFRELVESPDAATLAGQTVANFVETRKLPMTDAAATNRLLQTLFDAPEQKTSALQVALTAASDNATLTELLLNTGHGQSLLLEKGTYNLVRTMADNLHVEYNQKVIGVNRQGSPAVVMTATDSFLARQVVAALPPSVASSIIFSPPLEKDFQKFLQSYKPQGDAHYFTLTYPTAFWRGKGKSGQIIHTAAKGPLAWLTTFDMTTDTHCVSASGNTGILWGVAHFVQTLPERERFQTYSTIVKKSLKTDLEPLDINDMQLSSDPLALGSIGVLPPGVSLDSLSYLSGVVPHGHNTFFASAELSNISTGLMNGAVVAGELAAKAVAVAIPSSTKPVFRDSSPSTTSFSYSTTDHPPSFDDLHHIILAPALHVESPRSTPFQYSTSTHYPPSVFQNSGNEDAEVQQNVPRVQYAYRTSTMYPPTERPPETTTYKHFSFGNLKEEGPANMIANPGTEQSGRNFVYRTSTQYPPTERPPIASTFSHFSFGSLNENGRENMMANAAKDPSGNNFEYRTSTQYPPTERPAIASTFSHFSFGNINEEGPANMISNPSTEKEASSRYFEYRTSTQYPPTERPPATSSFPHFSFGNVGQPSPIPFASYESEQPSGALQFRTQSNVAPLVVSALQQVAEEAPRTDALSLARSLSSILQELLQGLRP